MIRLKKILNFIIEAISSPFTLLFRANAVPNPNKKVKPILVFLISALITALVIIFVYYAKDMIKWN